MFHRSENSNRRFAAHDALHMGAILAVVILLMLSLYSVAREAGKLLELSHESQTQATVTADQSVAAQSSGRVQLHRARRQL